MNPDEFVCGFGDGWRCHDSHEEGTDVSRQPAGCSHPGRARDVVLVGGFLTNPHRAEGDQSRRGWRSHWQRIFAGLETAGHGCLRERARTKDNKSLGKFSVPRGVPQIAIAKGILNGSAQEASIKNLSCTDHSSDVRCIGLQLTACVPSVQCRFPGGLVFWRPCTCTSGTSGTS